MVKRDRLTKLSPELRNAYKVCQKIANQHYENFPVASYMLPKHIRRSVAAIYAFARTADDIADEGSFCRETRLEKMTKFESHLYDIQYGKPPTMPIFIALQHTIEVYNLPIQLFYDLLTAFRQDILKSRYQNFAEVKDYCHYSANPVGRLLLHLTGQATSYNLLLSDHICTGLQLINFMQDIEIDLVEKDRCYIPLDELNQADITINQIIKRESTPEYTALIKAQLERASDFYNKGISLGAMLPGFFGFEIRFIISCGLKVLDKLSSRSDLFHRPTMSKMDMLKIFTKTIFNRPETDVIEPIMEKP